MWGKVSCLRKQYNGREWALNHSPSDLKFFFYSTMPRPTSFTSLVQIEIGTVLKLTLGTILKLLENQACHERCGFSSWFQMIAFLSFPHDINYYVLRSTKNKEKRLKNEENNKHGTPEEYSLVAFIQCVSVIIHRLEQSFC